MSDNHALLQQLGVSTPELDQLTAAALAAGAHGAKITGAGCGGFAVAIVEAEAESAVRRALDGLPGVFRLIDARPGRGALVVEA